MKVTICTPTYNRSKCLINLYYSIKAQTVKDFEWIIIDDGSTDNTREVVNHIIQENNLFPIKYKYKYNGGKHTAINEALTICSGEYFFIVDSDDTITSNAIEKIIEGFREIDKSFAGIAFNKCFSNDKIVGKTFLKEYVDATSLERHKNNIVGDKAEVFFTNIIKKYPFPVFENEKFLTEALIWNRIAADNYRIRWYNESIYICEYRTDGLSMNASGSTSFKGYSLYIKELLSYKKYPFKEKIRFLGVYSYIAKGKKLHYKEIAKLIDCSKFLIIMSRALYIIKNKVHKKNRKKELNIK